MNKRGLILFDIAMIFVMIVAMFFSSKITNSKLGLKESKYLTENSKYSFDFVADPAYSKVKAGETVKIKLSLKDINMGDTGLNNVIGYLTYDETVFEKLNIEGIGSWKFERNENKNHDMFGKFVIYTMQEGVKVDQDVVLITAKMKSDLKPQKTEINFTKLKSSDGEVSVDEEDKKAVIEIYEEGSSDNNYVEDEPESKEIKSTKTGDEITYIISGFVLAVIILNIIFVCSSKKDESKQGAVRVGVISTTLLILVGLIALSVTVFAHNEQITSMVNELDHKEYWLNSEEYLVTDESVSRIAPLTNIDEINDKFNKNITVYDNDEAVTSGVVKTGMIISDGYYRHDVSVLGDINGDGESDQVELTDIIRATVNSDDWNYTGVKGISADMDVDGLINELDVSTSIKYILYGELEIPEFAPVVEPKIEVVGGTFNDIIDAYEDTIEIKITEQDENATKTMYKVEGTTTLGYTEIESGETINIEEDGVYKISAYSYGVAGNRSEIPYIIVIKKNPNNDYKVKVRTEQLDGTYSESVENKQGRIGQTVTEVPSAPTGYSFNQAESELSGTIPEEGTLTLVVTYDLVQYRIDYDLDGGTLGTDQTGNPITNPTSYYVLTPTFTINNPTKDRYTFLGWTGTNTSVTAKTITISKGSTGDRSYTANWEETTYKVIVHHYLEETGPAYGNEPVQVADDELMSTKVLGSDYETHDLIPTCDEQGNILNEDANERAYLDPNEVYLVENSGNTTGVFGEDIVEVTYYYQYYPVVRVVSSPAEDLVGNEYVRVQDAIDALENAGLTRASEVTRLQMIRNSRYETVVVDDKNVELDLNNFVVKSNSETAPTIKLQNTTFTILDESENAGGKIISENSTGVYVTTDSELTLGVEARPVLQTPEIVAKNVGIEKEEAPEGGQEGIFNFFDGKITAKKAVKGTTDLTPIIYNATVTENDDSDEVSVLAIVSGKEARIGRQTYTLVESAIDAASTDGTLTEIVILKDISKDRVINIPANKNIKLDLDGYTLTTSTENYVIENNGKLEIVDSSANEENIYGNGKITSSIYDTIHNVNAEKSNVNAELKLTSGRFCNNSEPSSTASCRCVINNEAKLIIGDSTESTYMPYFNTEKTATWIVYGNGDITMNNGYIDAKYIGIQDAGSVIINGGTIKANEVALNVVSGATINGGTFNGLVKQYSDDNVLLINEGTFNNSVVAYDSSTINIKGGTFNLNVYFNQAGKIVIDGGTFQNGNVGFGDDHASVGSLIINGGTISSYVRGKTNDSIIVNGGTITGTIANEGNGTVTVEDGTCSAVTNNGNGTITVNDGAFTSIESTGTGTFDFYKGTVTSTGNVVYNSGTGTINIYDGEFTTTGNAVNNEGKGTINIEKATITAGTEKKGAFNQSTGRINIGKDDDNIQDNLLTITTDNGYAIYNLFGDVYVYDGTYKGKKDATIYGCISEIPEGTELFIEYEDEEKTKEKVTLKNPTIPVAQIGETTYTSLQSAVDACQDNVETDIKIIAPICLARTVNIGENQIINIDTNNYNINPVTKLGVFNNAGKLTLGDNNGIYERLDLSEKHDEGEYGFSFTNQELVPQNRNIHDSTANTYFTLDLRKYAGRKVTITVDAVISSESNHDFGYATITESTETPAFNNEEGRFILVSGRDIWGDIYANYNTQIEGGKIYYLHLGYRKDSANNGNSDKFNIRNIIVSSEMSKINGIMGNIIINSGEMNLNSIDIYRPTYKKGWEQSSSIVYNTGKLTLAGACISTDTYGVSGVNIISNDESGEIIMNNGKIVGCMQESCMAINSSATGNITINNGYIVSGTCIKNTNIGGININGGFLRSYYDSNYGSTQKTIYNSKGPIVINDGYILGYCAIYNEYGDVTLNDGYLSANTIEVSSGGTTTITGGSWNGGNGFDIRDGSLKITGGAISAQKTAVETRCNTTIDGGSIYGWSTCSLVIRGGTTTINGGTIRGNGSYGITISKGATVIANQIDLQVNSRYYAIDNSGIITILQGTVKNNSNYGIYNSNSGTVTIGTEDETISIDTPSIEGKTYGVYNDSGVYNMYDGILISEKNKSLYGNITTKPREYDLKITLNEDQTRETAYLAILNVAKIESTGVEYRTIQQALNACPDGTQETIKLLRNYNVDELTESVNIPAEKNIIFDIDGYTIVAANKDTFINKGTLEVIDSQNKVGLIRNTNYKTFVNQDSGTLKLSHVKLKNDRGSYTEESNTVTVYTVENAGTGSVTFDDVEITSVNAIRNDLSGNITVRDSKISASSLSISNAGSGSITYISTEASGERIIDNLTDGTVTIKSGTLSAHAQVVNTKNGVITIDGGELSGMGAVLSSGNSTITMNGGNVFGVYVYTYGTGEGYNNGKAFILNNDTLNITGGVISSGGGGSSIKSVNGGIVNISGGSIYDGIANRGTSKLTITGGNFGSDSRSCKVTNTSSTQMQITGGTFTQSEIDNGGTASISGGTFKINGTAIYNSGTMEVTKAKIECTSTNAIGINNEGTLSIYVNEEDKEDDLIKIESDNIAIRTTKSFTLGKDDGHIDNNSIKVISNNVGVQIIGLDEGLNYYDGSIIAPLVATGIIKNIPDNYRIVGVESEGVTTTTLRVRDVIAKIGNAEYKTLQSAIDAASSGATIKITDSYTTTDCEKAEIESGKNIILDLDGHTIKTHGSLLSNDGTLKIIDNASGDKGVITGYSKELITSAGSIEVNANIYQNNSLKIIKNTGDGTIKLSGGTITARGNQYGSNIAVYSESTGDINVIGGNIAIIPIESYKNDSCAIYSNGSSNINISGGTITLGTIAGRASEALIVTKKAEDEAPSVTITGGEWSCTGESDAYGLDIKTPCDVSVSNCNISMNSVGIRMLNVDDVNLTINNGTISGGLIGIYQKGSSNVTLVDGTIESTSTRTNDCGAIVASGDLKISGGTVKADNTNAILSYESSNANIEIKGGTITSGTCGINLNKGKATFTAGEINATGTGESVCGVYIATGEFTMGEKDYPVSRTTPKITSTKIGVNKTSGGTFNFYDGVIIGETEPLHGEVSDTPELFSVQYSDDNKTAVLDVRATFEEVAVMDNMSYNSLQVAINSAGQNAKVIEISESIVLYQGVTVAEGQNITIDLKGHSIVLPEGDYTIVNNGNLTIIDSQFSGPGDESYYSISNRYGTAIKNNGTLTLGINDGSVNDSVPCIEGTVAAIENIGTLYYYDGLLKATNEGATAVIGAGQTITD